jgi:DNA mismatch endonuclease, patch repair protein
MSKQVERLPYPPRPTSAAVSATMRGNRSKNTRPELAVRRLLFGLGYRYRLHRRDIPGCPDIAFLGRKKLIFVHGCFWHQHPGKRCPLRTHPRSNVYYWQLKLRRNRSRDQAIHRILKRTGWTVTVVWECETQNTRALVKRLSAFLKRRTGRATLVRSDDLRRRSENWSKPIRSF